MCKVCLDGYVLAPDRTRCFKKPTPPADPKERLPSCFKFATENYEECEICYEGYYLKDDNTKCVKHTSDLQGCDVYSQTQDGKCIFCSTKDYQQNSANPNDQCVARAEAVLNCERFSRTNDKCLECAEGHIFHEDDKRCSLIIPNCNIHNTTLRILQCTDCIDSHYLSEDSTQCYNANDAINGCQKYSKGPTCQICKQGFYLDVETKTCFFHDTFLNCKVISVTVKNICDTCNEEGIRTTKTHTCTPVSNSELIFDESCINWDENQKCIECLTDFVLKTYKYTPDTAGASEITTQKCQGEKGCISWDLTVLSNQGGCTECASGYYLYDYSCNKPDTTFCMYSFESAIPKHNFSYGTNLEGGFPCQICDEHRIFIVEQSDPEFRCIASSFFTTAQLVKDCLSFDKNASGGYDCRKCRRNFILSGNACSQRPYVATESFYVDMETMLTTSAHASQSVTITPKAGGSATTETWPLTDTAIGKCRVFGAGGKYCLEIYTSITESGVTKLYFPYYDFFSDISYSDAYKIDTTMDYTGIHADLKMDISPLMVNFTSYKQYDSAEDTGANRKAQEPYQWLDTVPVTTMYIGSWKIQNSSSYDIDAKYTSWSKLYSYKRADDSKGYTTVCEKNIYGYKIPGNSGSVLVDGVDVKYETNKLRIELDFTKVMEDALPFKITKKLKDNNKIPEMYPCDSSHSISECVGTSDVIDGTVRNLPYLSCYACNTDYAPRFTLFLYKDFHQQKDEYNNKVAMTDCVKVNLNTDAGNERIPAVANCYLFERVLHHVNNDIIHYCRNCKPGYYPKTSIELPRCALSCLEYQANNSLAYELTCDDWYVCQPKCPVAVCDMTEFYCNMSVDPFTCEPHACCDESKTTVANPTPTMDCSKDGTRFKCRRKECLAACMDTDGNDTLGLQCNATTARCEPKICTGSCICIKGECFSQNCRDCLDEPTNNDSTKFCKQNGSAFECVDYEKCEAPVSRVISQWRQLEAQFENEYNEEESQELANLENMEKSWSSQIPTVIERSQNRVPEEMSPSRSLGGGRMLEVITSCPLPCSPNCKKSNRNDLTADIVSCSLYSGACTKIYVEVWWVCKCNSFEKKTIKITSPNQQFDAYNKNCETLGTTTSDCLCLGALEHKNLELCDTHTDVIFDYSYNSAKSCKDKNTLESHAIAYGTGDIVCGWNRFKNRSDQKAAAVALAAALKAAIEAATVSVTNTGLSVTAIDADIASVDVILAKYPTNVIILAAKALADKAKVQAEAAKVAVALKKTDVENATTEADGIIARDAAALEESKAKAAEHAAQAALDTAMTVEASLEVEIDVTAVDLIDTNNSGNANIEKAKAVSDQAKTKAALNVAEAKTQMDNADAEMVKPDVAKALEKQVLTAAELEKAQAAQAGSKAANYASITALADLIVTTKSGAVTALATANSGNADITAAAVVSDAAIPIGTSAWTAASTALDDAQTKMLVPSKTDTETARDLVKAEMDKALSAQYGAEAAEMAANSALYAATTVTEATANNDLFIANSGNAEIEASKVISEAAKVLSEASHITLKAKLVETKTAMDTLVPADTLAKKALVEVEYNKIYAADSTTKAAHIYSQQVLALEALNAVVVSINVLKAANATDTMVVKSKEYSDAAKIFATTALADTKTAMNTANTEMGNSDAAKALAELVKAQAEEVKITAAKSLTDAALAGVNSGISVTKVLAVATTIDALDTNYVGDTNVDAVKVVSDAAKTKAEAAWTAIDALLVEAKVEMEKPDKVTTDAKKVLIVAEEAKALVSQHAGEAADLAGKVAATIAATDKSSADLQTLIDANAAITNLADVKPLADSAKALSATFWADTATALTTTATELGNDDTALVIAERDKIQIIFDGSKVAKLGLEAAEAGVTLAKMEKGGADYTTVLDTMIAADGANTNLPDIKVLSEAAKTAGPTFWAAMKVLLDETKVEMELKDPITTKAKRDLVIAELGKADVVKYALEAVDMSIKNEEMKIAINKISVDVDALVTADNTNDDLKLVQTLSTEAKTQSLTFWTDTASALLQLKIEMDAKDKIKTQEQRNLVEEQYNKMLATDSASKAAEAAYPIIPLVVPVTTKATAIDTLITDNPLATNILKAKILGDAANVQAGLSWTTAKALLLSTEVEMKKPDKDTTEAKKVLMDTELIRAQAATEASLGAESAALQALDHHEAKKSSDAAKVIIDTKADDPNYIKVNVLNEAVVTQAAATWVKIDTLLTESKAELEKPDKATTETKKTAILAEADLMETLKWAGKAANLAAIIAKNNKTAAETVATVTTVLAANAGNVPVTAVKVMADLAKTKMDTAWAATDPLITSTKVELDKPDKALAKAEHDKIEVEYTTSILGIYAAEGSEAALRVAVLEINIDEQIAILDAKITADAANTRLPEIKLLSDEVKTIAGNYWAETKTKMDELKVEIDADKEPESKAKLVELKAEYVKAQLAEDGIAAVKAAITAEAVVTEMEALHKISTDLLAANVGNAHVTELKNYTEALLTQATANWTTISTQIGLMKTEVTAGNAANAKLNKDSIVAELAKIQKVKEGAAAATSFNLIISRKLVADAAIAYVDALKVSYASNASVSDTQVVSNEAKSLSNTLMTGATTNLTATLAAVAALDSTVITEKTALIVAEQANMQTIKIGAQAAEAAGKIAEKPELMKPDGTILTADVAAESTYGTTLNPYIAGIATAVTAAEAVWPATKVKLDEANTQMKALEKDLTKAQYDLIIGGDELKIAKMKVNLSKCYFYLGKSYILRKTTEDVKKAVKALKDTYPSNQKFKDEENRSKKLYDEVKESYEALAAKIAEVSTKSADVANETTVANFEIIFNVMYTFGKAHSVGADTSYQAALSFDWEIDVWIIKQANSGNSVVQDEYAKSNVATTTAIAESKKCYDKRIDLKNLKAVGDLDAANTMLAENTASYQIALAEQLKSKAALDAATAAVARRLQSYNDPFELNGKMSTLQELWAGRILAIDETFANTTAYNDSGKYVKKSIYDAGYEGGCDFTCNMKVNDLPNYVNPLDATKLATCFDSCSTSDGLETCANGICEKNCLTTSAGLIMNCAKNETCTDNKCVSKPCEPVCDAVYETCDADLNKCIIKAKKTKITVISSCAAVANCAANYYLDKCYQCQNYFSFEVTATGNTNDSQSVTPALASGVDPVCLASSIANAIMASKSTNSEGTVVYKVEKCAPGHELDYLNNICVSKVKNCKLFNPEGECLGCDTPYETGTAQLVFGVFEKGYCKTWAEMGSDTSQDSIKDEFCRFYQYLFTNTSNPVSLKEGASTCYQCDTSHYFWTDAANANQKRCAKKQGTNCKVYDITSNLGVCQECEPGYKKEGTVCVIIENNTTKIPKCIKYDVSLNCIECESPYMLRQTGTSGDQIGFCFQPFADVECEQQDSTVFATNGAIQCQKCLKSKGVLYYPRKLNTAINACLSFAHRNLCIKHDFDKADSLALTNKFTCLECSEDYYLPTPVCVRRNNKPLKDCIKYFIAQDDCETYVSKTTVGVSTNEFDNEIESVQVLLLNPPDNLLVEKTINFGGWIMGCEIYKNETACERCFAPKFINKFGFDYNTKCKKSTITIPNCIAYNTDGETCDLCFPGYQLTLNQCLQITVENCATYQDNNSCATCGVAYPYLDIDGNCTLDPRNMFCVTYINSNDTLNLQASKIFECDTCMEGFYPDDNSICTVVESTVRNCKYYAGDGLCKECNLGFYLSYDGKNCFINPTTDTFCQKFRHFTECSVCEKGYFIDPDTKKCKACDTTKFPENCQYCDPLKNEICLMCSFGFEMKETGCVAVAGSDSFNTKDYVQPYDYFIVEKSTASTTQTARTNSN